MVAGSKAMYKGVGEIDGLTGLYKFKLFAIDGELKGDDIDRFRIKIWYEDEYDNEIIIYDNELGVPDDEDPTTAICEGRIVIEDGS